MSVKIHRRFARLVKPIKRGCLIVVLSQKRGIVFQDLQRNFYLTAAEAVEFATQAVLLDVFSESQPYSDRNRL